MTWVCTLGADIGTTSVKAVAFAPDGRVVARAARRLSMRQPEPGWAEQDVREIDRALTEAIVEVAAAVQHQGGRVARVGFSAAMHSLLAVDGAGEPLTPVLTWMDLRAAADAERLWSTPDGPRLYEATGTPIHPMAPVVKLLWLRRERPDIWQRAARFVSMKEWIWHRWFGEWEVDASIASATGLYDLRSGRWYAPALALTGLGEERLSSIVATTFSRSGVRHPELQATGLGDAVFTIGASDGVLANLGAGVWDRDELVLTVGTSCAVRTTHTAPVLDVGSRSFSYVLRDGWFVVGGPSNSGGVILDWLAHQLLGGGEVRPQASVDKGLGALLACAGEADTEGLYCLPYAAGERAPLWNPRARGAFIGLTLRHRPEHMMRAAVEGILFNAWWIASCITAHTGQPDRLLVSGPLFDTPWVRQWTADLFGLPVYPAGPADASAQGAAWLAELAAGERSWDVRPARPHTAAVTPRPDHTSRVRARFDEFRKLVEQFGCIPLIVTGAQR